MAPAVVAIKLSCSFNWIAIDHDVRCAASIGCRIPDPMSPALPCSLHCPPAASPRRLAMQRTAPSHRSSARRAAGGRATPAAAVAAAAGGEQAQGAAAASGPMPKAQWRTCRRCKQQFDPADNGPGSCRYHSALWTGGEISKVGCGGAGDGRATIPACRHACSITCRIAPAGLWLLPTERRARTPAAGGDGTNGAGPVSCLQLLRKPWSCMLQAWALPAFFVSQLLASSRKLSCRCPAAAAFGTGECGLQGMRARRPVGGRTGASKLPIHHGSLPVHCSCGAAQEDAPGCCTGRHVTYDDPDD